MNSLILRTSSQLVLPAALLFSLYVLMRGHNEPGGGFIGGLIAAAGIAVHALPRGLQALQARPWLHPAVVLGTGLLLAASSGVLALLLGQPYLTHQWVMLGDFGLGTTLVFDVGVYLVVIGSVLGFLSFYLREAAAAGEY